MIDLVFKNYTKQKAPGNRFFKKVLEIAARELKLKDKVEVSINLVGEKRIQELNKKYRNEDKLTDVLSFPLNEKLEIENWKLKIDKDVGDIFVCLSIAKKDAKREDVSIERKLAQLIVHGFLHLQGYDHENSIAEEKKMENLEKDILRRTDLGK